MGMTIFVILLGLILAGICTIVAANRLRRIDYTDIEIRPPDQPLEHAGPELRVLTWNIGYGALGKDADIYIDGGTSLRALSKQQIISAADAIAQELARTSSDLICIQEIARASFLTRDVDVRRVIDAALPNRDRYFWGDLKTVMLPRMLGISNGMATYCAKLSNQCHIVDLPDATANMLGFIKKPYVGLVNQLPIHGTDKAWVVMNIHLPIFNTTQAERTAQLAYLFAVAKAQYEKGNFVVIAGDWNTRLCPTFFDHKTDPKFLTVFTDFPQECLPAGWHIHTDLSVPTIRSLNTAFKRGQTYTTIFDGFVVSPNVRASFIKTLDLDFAYTDHQPVEAKFSIER